MEAQELASGIGDAAEARQWLRTRLQAVGEKAGFPGVLGEALGRAWCIFPRARASPQVSIPSRPVVLPHTAHGGPRLSSSRCSATPEGGKKVLAGGQPASHSALASPAVWPLLVSSVSPLQPSPPVPLFLQTLPNLASSAPSPSLWPGVTRTAGTRTASVSSRLGPSWHPPPPPRAASWSCHLPPEQALSRAGGGA